MCPEFTPETSCPQLIVDSFISGQQNLDHLETAQLVLTARQEAGAAGICLERILTDAYGPAEGPISVQGLNEQGASVTVPVDFGPAAACAGVCWLQQSLREQS